MFAGDLGISFLVAQLLLFIAVLMIFFSVRSVMLVHGGTVRRLRQKIGTGAGVAHGSLGLSADNTVLKQFEKYLTPRDPEKMNALRATLIRAGFRKPSAVRVYYAYRIGLSIGAVLLCVIVLPLLLTEVSILISLSAMLLIVAIAYFGPSFWVERTYQYRKMSIEKGFPDALDLLLVCIEAGNSFDQALGRVVKELKTTNGVLADELMVVTRELRAGKDRYKVLGDFADRAGVDGIISFITVIKQADKFGVSIAEALRVYSSEMRDKRYMKAEEKANLMPVKLALGAIMFTVPPAILVMVGPSVILIIRHLGGL